MDKEIVRNQVEKARQQSAARAASSEPSPSKTEVNISDEQLQKIVDKVVQQQSKN